MKEGNFDAVFYPGGHGPLWDLHNDGNSSVLIEQFIAAGRPEAAVELTDVVPYLLEDELIARGGLYQKVEDWNPLAIVDGLLITGQNSGSSEAVAEALIEAIQ